ncbi:MAG: T9SS type A sorting domain-containing protein [Candidatus Eisenbacteria sp.]|nr:T9SS type A sorting domain-containing protein [Candidatus Eisenbacteria bacterium]
MVTSGNRLLVLSLVLTAMVMLMVSPANAVFERGVRVKTTVAESTYVKIDVEDPAEADNPNALGVGIVSPGDKVRLLIHVQNTHNPASTVNAKDLRMLGQTIGFKPLAVVAATDETLAEMALLSPDEADAAMPDAGNAGDGDFAAAPTPDTTLWVDIDWLEANATTDSAFHYYFEIECTDATDPFVFSVNRVCMTTGGAFITCPDYTLGTAYYAQTAADTMGCDFDIDQGATVDFIVTDKLYIWADRHVADELYALNVTVATSGNEDHQGAFDFEVTFEYTGSDTDSVTVDPNIPLNTFPPAWGPVTASQIRFDWQSDNSGMGSLFNWAYADSILNPASGIFGTAPDGLLGEINLDALALYPSTLGDIGYIGFDFTRIADSLGTYGDLADATFGGEPEATHIGGNVYQTAPVAVLQAFPKWAGTDTTSGIHTVTVTLWDNGGNLINLTSTATLPAIDNRVPALQAGFTGEDITITEDVTVAGSVTWLNPASGADSVGDWVKCTVDLDDAHDKADIVAGGLVLFDLYSVIANPDTSIQCPGVATGWYRTTATTKATNYATPQVEVLEGTQRSYSTDSVRVNCYLIDDAGNVAVVESDGQYAAFKNVDNEIPTVPVGNIAIAFVDQDATGGPEATPSDVVTVMVDASGVLDESSVAAKGGTAFGETFTVADDGTDPDATVGDRIYTGDATLQGGKSLIDGLEYFTLVVTDTAGNVSEDIISTASLNMDTDEPTLTETNITIAFTDNPATPGIDGDANGDGVVADDDWVTITFDYQTEGLTDVVQGQGQSAVRVDLSTIDVNGGVVAMTQNQAAGVWTLNYQLTSGANGVSAEVGAKVQVEDDAGNQSAWVTSTTSTVTVDQRPPAFTEADILAGFATNGDVNGDGIAAIGDIVKIQITVDADSVEVNTTPINGVLGFTPMVLAKGTFSLEVTVTEDGSGGLDEGIEVKCYDAAGNSSTKTSATNTLDLDPDPPLMTADEILVFVSNDEVGGVGQPGEDVVNVSDEITIAYEDETQGDIKSVVVDVSAYDVTKSTVTLNRNFNGLGQNVFGWILEVEATGLDLAPGAAGTGLAYTVTDSSGNVSTETVFPEDSNVTMGGADPVEGARAINLASVDTDPPDTPAGGAFTLTGDLDANGIVNVGDRMDIVIDMGDPGVAGYDMGWENTGNGPMVWVDLNHYGLGAAVALTDDEYSVGGEGDGQWSYIDGANLQGFIVQPGDLDEAAGSANTQVEAWARDDDGNVDQTKVLTAVPDDGVAKAAVAVDTQIPLVVAADVIVTLHTDADANGWVNIGDSVLVSVDMSETAAIDAVSGVWALLGPWGDATQDDDELYVQLSNGTKADTWTYTHYVSNTDNAVLWDMNTGGAFAATLEVIAFDNAGNFSGYTAFDPVALGYTTSIVQDLLVDVSAPNPVTNLQAEILDSGRIKLTWTVSSSTDRHHYFVFADGGTGTMDYTTPVGGPVDPNTAQWVSDFLVTEEKATWLFAVRTYDDGGNDDGDTFWVTGGTPDDSAPVGTLASVPVGYNLGNGADIDGAGFVIMIHADVDQTVYPDVASCQFRYRIADIDPDAAGNQPGSFDNLGVLDATIPFEVSTAALLAAGGEGIFEIIARVFDDAGNYQTDDALAAKGVYTFQIDTTVPDVQIVSVNGNPSPNNIEVSGVVPVVIAAQDDVSSTFHVRIIFNGQEVYDETGVTFTENLTYNLDLTSMTAGAYTLQVLVYDEAGYIPIDATPTGGSDTITLVVLDTVVPIASFTTPTNGQRVPMGNVFVELQASTAPGASDIATAQLLMSAPAGGKGWEVVGTIDNSFDPEYPFNWDTSSLTDGETYWLMGKFWDASGNEAYSDSIFVIVDGTVMAVDLTIPEIQTLCDLPKVSGTSVELIASITGKDPVDIANVKFYRKDSDNPDFYNQWTLMATISQGAPGGGGTGATLFNFTWNTTGLVDGWDIRVIVTDTAGNVSDDADGDGAFDDHTFATTKAAGMSVWVDNTAPTVDIAKITSGGNEFVDPDIGGGVVWVAPGADITVESLVSNTDCDAEVWKVEYSITYDGSTMNIGISTVGPSFPLMFNPLNDGLIPPDDMEDQSAITAFTLRAQAYDHLGQSSTTTTVTVYILDAAATQVFVSEPFDGAYVRGDVCLNAKRLDDYTGSEYTWEYSTDQETWHLIGTGTTSYDTWETLNNVPDGPAWLRVTTVDEHFNTDTSPSIGVTVDNTAPTDLTLTGIPAMIGRTPVTLTTTATDASGIMKVVWQTKWSTTETDDWDTIDSDNCAPFAYVWDAYDWYDCSGQVMIRALVYDKAIECIDEDGNYSIIEVETVMDFCPPFGCISMINDTEAIHGDTDYPEFPAGQMTFYAWASDDPAEMPWDDCLDDQCCWNDGAEIIHSGVQGVQFQVYASGWSDIGLPVTAVGTSGYYELRWDNGEWSPGTTMRVRAKVIDNAYNWYEGSDCCPEVYFTIGDYTAPVATLRAIDPITGTLVYTASPDDADEIGEIEFRVMPVGKAESDWTIIGKRTGDLDNWGDCNDYLRWDYYDRWEFTNWPSGDYLLEARAFHNDHDSLNPLYDANPPTLMVRVDAVAQRVTVLPSGAGHLTSLEHLGIVGDSYYHDCEVINFQMTCDNCVECETCCGGPVLVFFGHEYPCDDHCDNLEIRVIGTEYNALDGLWRQVEYYELDWLNVEYEGNIFIVGSWWDRNVAEPTDPEVDAITSTVDIFRVTDERGTAGPVQSQGVTVDIPPGNGVDWYGLRMAKVPQPPTPPEQQEYLLPVGDTRSICLIDESPSLDNAATITIPFCTPVKGSFQSLGYTIGRWDVSSARWEFQDIWDVTVDEENCLVTFKTHTLGIFSVIQRYGLNIAGCGPLYFENGYTNAAPILKAYITDFTDYSEPVNGVDPSSIKAVLNGITILSGGQFAENWTGASELGFSSGQYYDQVSGLFAVAACGVNDLLHPGEEHTLVISARNVVGDAVTDTCTFKIDRTKPVVDWTGGWVGPDFQVEFNITDTEAGVDPRSVNLDFYSVVRDDEDEEGPDPDDHCCWDGINHWDGNESKEYRMQLTSDALTITGDTLGVTTVIAADIAMDIHHGEMLDVVLYSSRSCFECADYYDEGDHETDEIVYSYSVGVYDRVYDSSTGSWKNGSTYGINMNVIKPVERRYMVDGVAPELTLLTALSSPTLEFRLTDCGSGLDPTTIAITEDGEEVTGWSYDAVTKKLTYEPSGGGVSVVISIQDGVGNAAVLTLNTEAKVLAFNDVHNYPNPFDPELDGTTQIVGYLSQEAHVTVKIYDFAGEYVATLVEDELMQSVLDDLFWSGTDSEGNPVANGVYFCHIIAEGRSKTSTANVKIAVLRGSSD